MDQAPGSKAHERARFTVGDLVVCRMAHRFFQPAIFFNYRIFDFEKKWADKRQFAKYCRTRKFNLDMRSFILTKKCWS
jgi:hypothetical protein